MLVLLGVLKLETITLVLQFLLKQYLLQHCNTYLSNAHFSIAYANFSMLKRAKALLLLTLALLINRAKVYIPNNIEPQYVRMPSILCFAFG